MVKKKAPEPEEDLLGDAFGEPEPAKKEEPEEDLLGDAFGEPAPVEHHPEDDLMAGFDDFDIDTPAPKAKKTVKKTKKAAEEDDFLSF